MRSLLEKIEKKQEASYLGNLGAVEMMQFYRTASRQDVQKMERLLSDGDFEGAWALLQKVTGVKLAGLRSQRAK